jgi:hypothetical protein
VGVLGAVGRPGVYELPGDRVELADLLRWSDNLTQAASGNIRLLRKGTVQSLDISAQSLRSLILPGDVLVFDSRPSAGGSRVPDGGVQTQSLETADGHSAEDADVQLAFLGLFDRPVIGRMRPGDATLSNLLRQLGQAAEIAATVRVIPPGKISVEKCQDQRSEYAPLESGSVVLFEPSTLRHDLLQPPLPVIRPDAPPQRPTMSSPINSETRAALAIEAAESLISPVQVSAAQPSIHATFVSPTDALNISPEQVAGATASVSARRSSESLDADPRADIRGQVASFTSEQTANVFANDLNGLEGDLSGRLPGKGIDVNNARPGHESTAARDFAIRLDPEFDESDARTKKDRASGWSFLWGNGIVAAIIGGLAGTTFLFVCGSWVFRLLFPSPLDPADVDFSKTPAVATEPTAVEQRRFAARDGIGGLLRNLPLRGILDWMRDSIRMFRHRSTEPGIAPRMKIGDTLQERSPESVLNGESTAAAKSLTGVRLKRRSSRMASAKAKEPATGASGPVVPFGKPQTAIVSEPSRATPRPQRVAPQGRPVTSEVGTLGRALSQLQARGSS